MNKQINRHLAIAIVLVVTVFTSLTRSHAQAQFLASGKIEFEKKLNVHKEIEDNSWYKNFIDKIPKYRTSYHLLYFKDGKTLYEKGRDANEKITVLGEDRSEDDIIYTDLTQGVFQKKQAVFDEVFLIQDSIRNIKWQMTDDLRDIAGFECRKATAIILDSIYVVAFYTDQITVSGGPLSFCNLPGMILGLAIPRHNLTIFATKVELENPAPQKLVAPTARKKTNYRELQVTIEKALKDWGSYGRKYIPTSLY